MGLKVLVAGFVSFMLSWLTPYAAHSILYNQTNSFLLSVIGGLSVWFLLRKHVIFWSFLVIAGMDVSDIVWEKDSKK